jgi:selenocysteine-specific elongation factor
MSKTLPELEHVIIGTAGHIDHGKTALIKALTGIDADTLAEEKRRGITIELGFVFMDTPGYDKQIVFIDVPGHEKLIKTMVAGASNIDAALLVIAADEGIGLQTREHFDILQLLEIQGGIIALAKTDLVDEARLEKLTSEVKNFVKGSFLKDAPIIPVSSVTGSGVDELKSALMRLGRNVEKRHDTGIFRMPVDRVFTMHGFGTVIAGTILSGEVKTGDRIEIFPDGIRAKVRGLQVHGKSREESSAGKRTALNLQDIKKELLRRGQCAGSAGSLSPTLRLDARLRLLKSYEKEMKNSTRVRLHTGTDEVISRLVLLDREKLLPGETGLVQFVLEAPTVALPGDRFVIRSFSPLFTIGGGRVLDAAPGHHKRFDARVIEGLRRFGGSLPEVIEQSFIKSNFIPQNASEAAMKIGERENEVREAIKSLGGRGTLVRISSEKAEKYLHSKSYEKLAGLLTASIKNYFSAYSYRLFVPFADLRSQFLELTDLDTFKALIADLISKKIIYKKDSQIGLVGHEISLKPKDEELTGKIEQAFKRAGFSTPLEEDVRQELQLTPHVFKEIMNSLIEQKKLIRLNKKVTYHREHLRAAQEIVAEHLRKKQSITIAELRDKLHLSRKYGQAILEYLDSIGLTKRKEDRHVIK